MRKSNTDIHKLTRSKYISEAKINNNKNSNIKNYKSKQKLQYLKGSQHDFRINIKNENRKDMQDSHKNDKKQKQMRLQKRDLQRQQMQGGRLQKGRKMNSDEQSTKANGLLESGEILGNLKLKEKINEDKEKKGVKQNNNKMSKSSEQNSLRQSLKSRIAQFKILQKQHDQETKQLKNKLSVQEAHRLQKIQSIEKVKIHNQILSLQKKFTKFKKQDLKYSHQFTIQRK